MPRDDFIATLKISKQFQNLESLQKWPLQLENFFVVHQRNFKTLNKSFNFGPQTLSFPHRVMLFIFALPVMQVILFCLAIGRDPTGLHLAIVNQEMDWATKACPVLSNCSFTHLSCRYLNSLPNDTIVKVSCFTSALYLQGSASIHCVCFLQVRYLNQALAHYLSGNIIC